MPAFLYKRQTNNGKRFLEQVRQISLAGSRGGAIHSLWSNKGKPLNNGWHITADDLREYAIDSAGNVGDYEIIIDAAPSLPSLVDLVKVVDIYVYTYGDTPDRASWSNLMLRVKSVYEENVTPSQKAEITKSFEEKEKHGDIFTFLYLNGDPKWIWGRIGQMNGAWIHRQARDYFRQFFQ